MTDSAARATLVREVARRRVFAIISHPDAGKTTLTEKLLLYSGMVRTAGMVGGRKGSRAATSDWMSMEQERGISITASAMQFTYKGVVINILDTPGHQDFSEDTYRTLTAADSVIMVIDGAKGVEAQTRKLFDACRLRRIPVFTFMNKWDTQARDPLDLMHELEEILGIHTSAVNWPIGTGADFKGVIVRATREVELYRRTSARGSTIPETVRMPLSEAAGELGEDQVHRLEEELELLEGAGNSFDRESFLEGMVTPVFFGSALTNFGVEPLFDAFIQLAPSPAPRAATTPEGERIQVSPHDLGFSANVFKLQANMNPKHRDCVAFLRVNSGLFERDMLVTHERLGRKIRLARPHTLMVSERETLEVAYPGDIIGVINPGNLQIGDSLSEAGNLRFDPLPQFQPEHFARVEPVDMGRRKALDKGLEQLAQEGAVQMLWDRGDRSSYPFLAAVGKLQFEVIQYRLEEEYGVKIRLAPLPFERSAWLVGDPTTFATTSGTRMVEDRSGRPMVLFASAWEKDYCAKKNPDHTLLDHA